MKKFMKEFGVAGLVVLVGMTGAMAANVNASGVCKLVAEMHEVFVIMRTLAFVGAAFSIAGWAWGYISKGDAGMDDLKKKGTGLLVGFVLLFGIGIVLQFLASSAGNKALGCPEFGNW